MFAMGTWRKNIESGTLEWSDMVSGVALRFLGQVKAKLTPDSNQESAS